MMKRLHPWIPNERTYLDGFGADTRTFDNRQFRQNRRLSKVLVSAPNPSRYVPMVVRSPGMYPFHYLKLYGLKNVTFSKFIYW